MSTTTSGEYEKIILGASLVEWLASTEEPYIATMILPYNEYQGKARAVWVDTPAALYLARYIEQNVLYYGESPPSWSLFPNKTVEEARRAVKRLRGEEAFTHAPRI
jgi:hypothetical protein